MKTNWLKLNDEKTEVMVFSSKSVKQEVTIKIGDSEVAACESVRNLGVLEDARLSMKKQVNSVCRASFYHLRNISRIRCYLTSEATKLLVHAFVITRLDYANSLYHGMSKQNMDKLQRVQNAAARLICRCGRRDHISPILSQLHWLPVAYRVQFKVLVQVYRATHDQAPSYICDMVQCYQPGKSLRSQDQNLLVVPKTKKVNYGDRAFSTAGPVLWNALPLDVRCSETLVTFRKRLKTYLFRLAFT